MAPELSSLLDDMEVSLKGLVLKAKELYETHLKAEDKTTAAAWIAVAPGRVNLIGEHTDYTGGFVLPLAIEYSTVVYGTGKLVNLDDSQASSRLSMEFISNYSAPKVTVFSTEFLQAQPPASNPDWTHYVIGTVAQYFPDMPATGVSLQCSFAIAGNVPLGSGLSSSASLEVSVARFVECIVGEISAKERALRCQKAENTWCHSPCGIMDQYISSAGTAKTLLMIDCRSYEFEHVKMGGDDAVLVVANSNVEHSIGGGEYPIRVQQCQEATLGLQKKFPEIQQLRDATLQQVLETTMPSDVIFRRARHVVTENCRVHDTKTALEAGDWQAVGELMNASHVSMRDDYETSCPEVDILVELAQKFDGVYGSRLTGGGFGGCTVTLVTKEKADAFMKYLQAEYMASTGKDCSPFTTLPAEGARLLAIDTLS